MKKWTLLDAAAMPDGRTLTLNEHDGDYSVRIDGTDLMSTRRHASEEKLAEVACANLRSLRGARVLIGGLGFGFTLRAALAALAPDAEVLMAELLGAVIAWNRNPSFPLAAAAMADPRVTVLQADVADVLAASPARFDAILLDVDNGPAAFSTEGNDRLYDPAGLESARAALRPAGCVAFWSAAPDPRFAKRLARAGFVVTAGRCGAHAGGGGRHTIYLGRIK